jgi:hypothetical protein
MQTFVRNTTAGGHADRPVTGWPRPAEYYETDDYLVDPWADGLPRWVAVHIVLGSLAGGVFIDGESIAAAEARVGDTIGPVQLKLKLTADYMGSGKTVRVTATNAYTGAADVLEATVPQGADSGDLVFLKWAPHDEYPGARNWYTDVTAVSEVSGDGYLACQIVNDGPSWRSSTGVIVLHNAHSPYAVDARLGGRDPYMVTEARVGTVHLVYLRDGQVMHSVKEFGEAFADPYSVTQRANWAAACRRPCIGRLYQGGALLCSATSNGATWFWRSQTNGDSWETLTNIPVEYAQWFVEPRTELLHLVGLQGGAVVYSWSDTNGLYWSAPETVATSDGTVPPTITRQGARLYVQAYVGGRTRTYRYTGAEWQLAGSLGT